MGWKAIDIKKNSEGKREILIFGGDYEGLLASYMDGEVELCFPLDEADEEACLLIGMKLEKGKEVDIEVKEFEDNSEAEKWYDENKER